MQLKSASLKMEVTNEHLPQGQGMDKQHNALENTQTDLLPSGQQRCKRDRKGRQKCQELALPGDIYCDKHRFEQDIYCEKLKTARKKKENHSLTDPLLPSGQRQCRSTGKGWRCSPLAPPSKDVASEREQNAYNKKECRKRKDRGLIESDEMNSSSGDCSTVLKRARENVEERSFEEVRVESLKRDSGKDVVSEESLFPVNEGVVGEHAGKNPSITQIDSVQLLCVSLEDHQVRPLVDAKANPSTMEDNDDNQVIPVDSITIGESTVESVEQPQSLNKVEDPLDFEFTVEEGVLPTLDITCSSPIQQEESPLPLENVSSFVKTSHLWKQIYSLETFKKSPQYPHFRPLQNVHEEIREGKAMGLMLNFDQLMESTLRAQIDIPETVLINRLNALTDLEQYGFTVHPLRSRLEKLLKIKKDYILLNESFKAAEEEFTNEKHHLDEMKESISQLNMKLQQFSAEKEIKDRKVLELRKIETEAEEKIQHIQVEFDRVVAAFGRNLGY